MSEHLPVISGADLIKAPQRAGWERVRQRGSHVRLKRSERTTALVVPLHHELKRATLSGILRDAGLSADELRALLQSGHGSVVDPSPCGRFTFKPLRREDLALLMTWLAERHVAAWWDQPPDPDGYYFREGGGVRRFVADLDGRPVGMIQLCETLDSDGEAGVIGAVPGEVGIDYLIGERGLIGRGVGPVMIQTFLNDFLGGRKDVTGVRVDVAEANRRSWRALEKLGFIRDREGVLIDGQAGPHYVYVLDLTGPQRGSKAS